MDPCVVGKIFFASVALYCADPHPVAVKLWLYAAEFITEEMLEKLIKKQAKVV